MASVNDLYLALQAASNDDVPGLSLTQLEQAFPSVARRSLQRQLAQWLQDGAIQVKGQARARRFFAAQTLASSKKFVAHYGQDTQDIIDYLDKPLNQRIPVGYQRDFLEAYQPNQTAYLPAQLRKQLYQMGRTASTVQAAGTYSRAILNRLLIDLSWASSHLEGNTYSLLDTRELITHGKAATGKAAIETQMILNHKSAIELLVENADTVGFDRFTLLNLHSALAENLLPNPADEGRLRQHVVDIGLSVYRPMGVPSQIEEAFESVLAKCSQIQDPFEQSFFIMVHLPYVQPFADINKRCSRLAANLPLFRANLCPLTFLGVPAAEYSRAVLGIYELTRVELLRDLYVWAYERSTQEYLAIRQDTVEPNPLRLAWRDVIKHTVRSVVLEPQRNALTVVEAALEHLPDNVRNEVRTLILDEIKRLHEGVLARYGLRVSDLESWHSKRL